MNSWFLGYLARIGFAALLGIAGLWLATSHPEKVGAKSFCFYYGFRLISMFCLCVIVGQLPADVGGWYLHAKWMSADGLFPGKGFLTPYYLGMNGLLWLAVKCWDNPFSIVLIFTLIEAGCVALLFWLLRRYVNVQTAKRLSILYLTSPIVTMCSWLGAQDESLILLAVVCVFGLMLAGRPLWTLFVASFFGIFFSKILTIFFLQPLFFYRRYKSFLLCALGFAFYVIVALVIGVNPFNMSFGREVGLVAHSDALMELTTIGNIWFLLRSVPDIVQLGFFACMLGAVSFFPLYQLFFKQKREDVAMKICLTILVMWALVFMLFYRMSFATYLIAALPFIWYLAHQAKLNLWTVLFWTWLIASKDSFHYGRAQLPFSPSVVVYGLNIYAIICIVCTGIILIQVVAYSKKLVDSKDAG